MNNKPLISVIVPVYNSEFYIEECIKSLINQSYSNLEIILIDDGSNDNSLSKCNEWAEKDDRIICYHQHNKGPGAARNLGLKKCHGDLIAFVDSDDLINVKMYENLLTLLLQNAECDMAMCDYEIIKSRDIKLNSIKKTNEVQVLTSDDLLLQFMRINGERSNYSIWNKLIKKEVIKNFSFEEKSISEDVLASYYFYTHVNYAVYTDETYYYYYENNLGLTKSKLSKRDLGYVNAFEIINKDIKVNHHKYLFYSQMNVLRSKYTLVSKGMIYGYDKSDSELSVIYDDYLTELKNNFFILFKWLKPISRKILLVLIMILSLFREECV